MNISRRGFLTGAAAGVASIAAAGVAGCAPKGEGQLAETGTSFEPGTYTASADGKNGKVTVKVEFNDAEIMSVNVIDHDETTSIANSALKYIPLSIVDGQTLAVDSISGATLTSDAIRNAVADCVVQAKGDAEVLRKAPSAPENDALTAGTYNATAHGHHSDVDVECTLGANSIDEVKVVSCGETFNLSDSAVERIPAAILSSQTTGVDTVSGATYTSRAIMSAVEDCIEQAGGVEAVRAYSKRTGAESWSTESHELSTDVVVVGSGMAGIAAALSAQENGANVILVEKLPFWGGVSQTCKGYFRLPFDDTQESAESYYQYGLHMHCGNMQGETMDDEYPDKTLMRVFADNAYAAGKWLESMGAPLEWLPKATIQHMPEYYLGGAHFVVDGDQEAPNVTAKGFKILLEGFVDRGGQILLETAVKELLVDGNGAITGVKASGKDGEYTIAAKAVCLCAGGFGANPELISEFTPSYEGEHNVTLVGNVGDGIMMGIEAGAATYDRALMMGQFGHSMVSDYDMIHPYEDDETPSSCIFVNPQGLRVNSETPVAYSGGTTYVNPNPAERDYYWAVMNEQIASSDPEYRALLDEQLAAGNKRFYKADTMVDLAKAIRITPATLAYSINRYNSLCEAGKDTDYFKDPQFLVTLNDEGPWYAVKCPVVYFGTVGGLRINDQAAVLDSDGNPIQGLFAAGENANGGLFNLSYVGGRSMPVCLTMGRIAGANAAQQ